MDRGEHVAGPDAMSLAFDRTRLAYERTLMAWIRTATSLITFGFTIYKFFSYLRESQPGLQHDHAMGPRTYALVMIGVGLLALTLATVQHQRSIRWLRRQSEFVPPSLASWVAGFIALLGISAFVTVLLRM